LGNGVYRYLARVLIILQFPWNATAFYTMHERQQMVLTYFKCLTALDSQRYIRLIGPAIGVVRNEYIITGLNCPGFTEFERNEIRCKFPMRPFRPSKHPDHMAILEHWPFYALHLNPDADLAYLKVCGVEIISDSLCRLFFHCFFMSNN
jgi:hypothetical protein